MINHETELKVQAYLDGELSSGEAKAVEDLSTHDADARALFEELKGFILVASVSGSCGRAGRAGCPRGCGLTSAEKRRHLGSLGRQP
ncbi:MAG: hypothetical protein DME24_19830 [Verrucomicrobia bacterium]|nr:MAG: hypothetical protein DME24_19830 [Verrucomicrobiota bacterium]